VINGHGGNLRPLLEVALRAREELGIIVAIYQWWTALRNELLDMFEEQELGHAGAAETSLIAYLKPDNVKLDQAVDKTPRNPLGGIPVYAFTYTHEVTSSGVYGKSSTADSSKGSRIFEAAVNQLVRIVETLKKLNV